MTNNKYFEHLRGIAKIAAGKGCGWQTAIDEYNVGRAITKDMSADEIDTQRSEFLAYVGRRKFDKEGNEIKTKKEENAGYVIIDGVRTLLDGDTVKTSNEG